MQLIELLLFIFSSESAAFDEHSASVIKLNNGTILYLREVNRFLALVCILRQENFGRQGTMIEKLTMITDVIIFFHINFIIFLFVGIIDYNFLCFRKAISQVFEVRSKGQITANNEEQMTDRNNTDSNSRNLDSENTNIPDTRIYEPTNTNATDNYA